MEHFEYNLHYLQGELLTALLVLIFLGIVLGGLAALQPRDGEDD